MIGQPITGQVAAVEDEHTLIINRGADAGVMPGMIFVVLSDAGRVITDPESGRFLGRLNTEKLRVRVFDVQPLFARAQTFVTSSVVPPFAAHRDEAVITIDIGDAVELSSDEYRAEPGWTHR